MTVLDQLASAQGLRTEQPNVDLGRDLAENPDADAVAELIAAATGDDGRLAGDALTALRELAAHDPGQLVDGAPEIAGLLASKSNRLVWGATEALHYLSATHPETVAPHADALMRAVTHGSVITCDHGVGALANVAEQRPDAVEFVLDHLRTCGAKYVPLRMSRAMRAVTDDNRDEFLLVLDARAPELNANAAKRLAKVRRDVVERIGPIG